MPIKITGTGSYIPKKIVKNDEFIGRDFFDKDGNPYPISNKEIIGNESQERMGLIIKKEKKLFTKTNSLFF